MKDRPASTPASDATHLGVTSEGALESAETVRADRRDDPTQPRLPGRYVDLGLVARGAFGEVRRVRDTRLNRVLAMKLLHPEVAVRPAVRQRFFTEIAITAELQHPGIVPVYEHGELDDGRLWYTMKEVRGVTLGRILGELHAVKGADGFVATPSGWTFRRVLDAFARITQTVAYAHRAGFVHRDLKPENLMVGELGEVLVMDWGLARRGTGAPDEGVEDDGFGAGSPELTRHGDILGTPAYMSPEQASGARELHGPPSDVYALGAILYHVLSGQAPHHGLGLFGTVRRPVPLEEAARGGPTLPPTLVVACLRAMQEEREARGTAEALAADVLGWLDGERKRDEALGVLAAARALEPTMATLRASTLAARAEARARGSELRAYAPLEEKRPIWALEDRAEHQGRAAALAETQWLQAVHGALSVDPELPEAHAMLAEFYRAALAEAERTHREEDAARCEVMLRAHDRGHHAAFLRGEARLTLYTEPAGAEARLFRMALTDRRLVPVFERSLGPTPLVEVPIQHGSWLVVLRAEGHEEVRYPVFLERDGHWSGAPPGEGSAAPVRLPRVGSLGPDDLLVPGSWTWTGGDPLAPDSLPRRRLWLDSFVIRRFPVTNGEYLAFLNDLVASGREDEARQFCPRRDPGSAESTEVVPVWPRDGAGKFVLPTGDEAALWAADVPVVQVSWFAARAYADWEATRSGLPWRLPNELEREKAARGVDGRTHAWGDHGEVTFACVLEGHAEAPRREPVTSHPTDESPYGVRGLTGNVRDWCLNVWRHEGPPVGNERVQLDPATHEDPDFRSIRGGFWAGPVVNGRAAGRFGGRPGLCRFSVGIRLARSLGPGST